MARKSASSALAPVMRPDLSLSREEADLSAAAVDQFTVAIGGRQALLDTLVVADGTPEVHKIVDLLVDSRYGGWSLRRICAQAGLTIADLFVAYRKALIVRAHLQATRLVADHLVAVVDDVMKRAQPHEVPCADCGGLGHVTPEPTKAQPNPGPQPCETCRGGGRLLQLPDLDRQKVALELGQLLRERGGILVQQQNLTLPAGGTAPGSLEQLQQAVQAVLYQRSPSAVVTTEEPSADAGVSEG
jgi:hypothetical protein